MNDVPLRPPSAITAVLVWTVFCATLVLTAVVFWNTSGTPDVEIWRSWFANVRDLGPVAGYAHNAADYPPGPSFVFWTLARFPQLDAEFPLKQLLLIMLLVTTTIVLVDTRSPGRAAFTHASLSLSALGLMYLDILMAPFVMAAIWAARTHRTGWMIALLSLACVMKWQPVLLLPFAFLYAMKLDPDIPFARRVGSPLLAVAVVWIPVLLVYGAPVVRAFLWASRHGSLSSLAANIPWIATWWLERFSAERLQSGGLITIVAASRPTLRILTLVTLVLYTTLLQRYWRSADRSVDALVMYSLAGFLVYVTLAAGVHENHLFAASLLGLALGWQSPRYWWVALTTTVAANLNVVAFYGWSGYIERHLVAGVDPTLWLAIVVSAGSLALIVATLRGTFDKAWPSFPPR